MVSFRTMAEKITKQELMNWAEQRLNLVLTKNMTKIEMERSNHVRCSQTRCENK
jgi:hypothetical protein